MFTLTPSGADDWAQIVLEYGPEQRAILYYDSRTWLPQSGFVAFDGGHVQLPNYFWCPERLVVWEGKTWYDNEQNRKELHFPLKDDRFFNYNHSSGLRYEADHLYDQVQLGECAVFFLGGAAKASEGVDAYKTPRK